MGIELKDALWKGFQFPWNQLRDRP